MHKQHLSDAQNQWHATYKSYIIGFILSLFLTLTSFILIGMHLLSKQIALFTIVSLAIVQAMVQLIFFFHLRKGPKPDWQNIILISMITVLLIIVVGSLWIMHDLDLRTMSNMTMTILQKGNHD